MVGASNVKSHLFQRQAVLKSDEKRLAYIPGFRDLLARLPEPEDLAASYPWDACNGDLDWMMRHNQNFYLPALQLVGALVYPGRGCPEIYHWRRMPTTEGSP